MPLPTRDRITSKLQRGAIAISRALPMGTEMKLEMVGSRCQSGKTIAFLAAALFALALSGTSSAQEDRDRYECHSWARCPF
jgi:hypothetical protein